MNLSAFRERPIMGILRGIEFETVESLITLSIESGLKAIEITMNTREAARIIKEAKRVSCGKIDIGAGTVLNSACLNDALNAGAGFIVMPSLIPEVVKECVEKSIPVFPGALTPQEIINAWTSGATMVKLFPANAFGPSYVRDIKGPFDKIEILACGGVTADNISSFFRSGASAVAFGGSIFKRDLVESENSAEIASGLRKLIDSYENSKQLPVS
jgi:2-dehydro-3-deoxyphosphogluconate aldolase/(4S)-4-hydroxy-2-oxoglutarate aldolase